MKLQTPVITQLAPLIFMASLLMSITACAERSRFESISQDVLLEKANSSDLVIIDVRTSAEYARGYIPHAINIPHDKILHDPSILNVYKDQEIVFYCHSGVRVGKVLKALSADHSTTNLYHLQGDYRAWHGSGKSIVVK